MKKKYQVDISASFIYDSSNPESIREHLKKIIMQQGFEDKSFEISIVGLSAKGEFISPIVAPVIEVKSEVKIDTKAKKNEVNKDEPRKRKTNSGKKAATGNSKPRGKSKAGSRNSGTRKRTKTKEA